ncbi:MAG: hypothetical protein ACMUHM_06135, partial [Thermoplasmatota archaeon]
MKGSGLLALALVTILLAVPVSGQVHHEDYDKAKLDLDSIRYFLASTKEDVNRTLEALLSENIGSAVSHSKNFTGHVERIGETLEKIPPEIDSYAELSLYHGGLTALDGNLSQLVSFATEVLEAVETASNFTISQWNITVVRGALEAMDKVLLTLPGAISGLGSSLANVDLDLKELQKDGLNLDHQLFLLSDVSEHYIGLDTSWIVPDIARDEIISGLMAPWAGELFSIRFGNEPSSILLDRIDLIGAVSLRSSLSGVIAPIIRDFREISGSITVLFDLFNEIGEQKELLDGIYRYRIEGQYEVFRAAQENILEISSELRVQRTVLERYAEDDDGSVNENLTALEKWLAALEQWFDSLTLFEDDLQALSDLMSRILWLQVTDPDSDGDGNLSFEEGHTLVIDLLSVSLLDNMTGMKDELEDEILSIQGPLFDRYMPVFSLLNATAARISTFTTSHKSLVEDLVFLTEPGTGADDLQISAYTRAAGSYLRMVGALEGLSLTNLSLEGTNITFDNTSVGPLEDLLSLYRDLLLLISRGRNLTGLYLEVDKETVTYGSEVQARVLIVERDLDGITKFPDGETVRLFLDNMNLTNLTTRRGSAVLLVPIGFDLETGSHTISASYMPENGTFLNRSVDFKVRRIYTVTKVYSDLYNVEPDVLFPIHIMVRDEYGRSVPGNITVLEGNYTTDGNLSVDISLEGFGDRWLRVFFHGDRWFGQSYGWKLFNVSTDPVLELLLENDSV